MKEFDPKTLEEFDGQEGRPCYVAVQGKVYDISGSSLWENGKHMGQHTAGCEQTESLQNAPHEEEVFDKFQQVGILKTSPDSELKKRPAWSAFLLKQHPHPITVHFPQAILSLAPVFLILFYLTGNIHFERTCYYLGVMGFLTAIPAIITGFFHWIFKYGKSKKGIYIFKMTMSLLLFFCTAVVIYIHTVKGVLVPEPINISMVVLYLLLIPLTVITGHTGGKIAFG